MTYFHTFQTDTPDPPSIVSIKPTEAFIKYAPGAAVITAAHDHCRVPETGATGEMAALLKTAISMVESHLQTPIKSQSYDLVIQGMRIHEYPIPRGGAAKAAKTSLSAQRGIDNPFTAVDDDKWELVGGKLTVQEYTLNSVAGYHPYRWKLESVTVGLWGENVEEEAPAEFFMALYQTVAYLYANRGDMKAPDLVAGIPATAAAMITGLRYFG